MLAMMLRQCTQIIICAYTVVLLFFMLLPSTGSAAKFHKNNGETITPIIEPIHSIQISSYLKLNFAKKDAAILRKSGFQVDILGIYNKQ